MKKSNIKNITKLTITKHKFDGYSVRVGFCGMKFRQYISASATQFDRGCGKKKRFEIALGRAQIVRNELLDWLNDPRSWNGDTMKPYVEKYIYALGFTIE